MRYVSRKKGLHRAKVDHFLSLICGGITMAAGYAWNSSCPSNAFQVLLRDARAFLSQMRYIVLSESALGSSQSGGILIKCLNDTMEERTPFTARKHYSLRFGGRWCPKRRSLSISGSRCENVRNGLAVWCSCIDMAKSRLSRKVKLFINLSISSNTQLWSFWMMTKKIQLWIQAAKRL